MRLGEILVKQGLLSQSQLASALAHQQAQGSRLGTYLVEKNVLTSDQVALALAEQHGVAPALESDFQRADAALRKRLLVHQAVELQAIPLRFVNPRRVAVAMANPSDPRALDRLAFILGATIEPLATPEIALNHQFEILYRVRQKRAARAVRLALAKTGASRTATGRRSPAGDSEIRPALRSYRRPAAAPPLAPLLPFAGRREPATPVAPMPEALCYTPTPLSALPQARAFTPPPPARVRSRHRLTPVVVPITPAGAELAVEQIRFAATEQDLSDNLFAFMRTGFGVGAMFAVTGNVAQGAFGFSDGRIRPEVEKLCFPLTLPSCFRIARSRRATFRGQPPPDGGAVHGPLWRALHSQRPTDVLVAPVIVDGLVTLLLYAHGETGGRINDIAVGKIKQVCEALGSSLLRLAV